MNENLWNEPFDMPAVSAKTEPLRPYPAALPNVTWHEAAFGRSSSPVVEPPTLVKHFSEQVAAFAARLKRVEAELAELRRRPEGSPVSPAGVADGSIGEVDLASRAATIRRELIARTHHEKARAFPVPTDAPDKVHGEAADVDDD